VIRQILKTLFQWSVELKAIYVNVEKGTFNNTPLTHFFPLRARLMHLRNCRMHVTDCASSMYVQYT